MITEEQKNKVLALYNTHEHSIKDIMLMTGVKSSQTIYRILSMEGVRMQKDRQPVRKISVGLDEEAHNILLEANPKNVSEWVCNLIKGGYPNR
ncbi:MAG: hypothetical protein MSD82_12420 [Prevotella sp.]|nr:hypothetical protein [Prevotella sp.]